MFYLKNNAIKLYVRVLNTKLPWKMTHGRLSITKLHITVTIQSCRLVVKRTLNANQVILILDLREGSKISNE